MANRVKPAAPTNGGAPKLLYVAQCKMCKDGVAHSQCGPQVVLMQTIQKPQPLGMEILYGGAAGGGKSYALRMLLVNYCLQYPGAQVVLFRRTYKELEDTHIKMLLQELPSYVATYKVGSHEFVFKNGSVLMLRFCEHEDDVYSYDTFEADIMGFDELTAFTEFQYVYLFTRCRSSKKWWTGRKIISCTNPGNVGHVWVKRRFIDFAMPYAIKQAPVNEGSMMRMFIPAKVDDNPALTRMDPNYINALRALPDELYRAKALGDWNVFTGQFFSRWRDDIHTVDPFMIPPEWTRYITVDWGIHSPHAVYWAARPPGTNTLYVYREQYGAGIPTKEQAQMARERTVAAGEKIQFIVTDPAMWAKGHDADGVQLKSTASYWKDAFAGICEIVKGNNERIMGASLMRELLDWVGVELQDRVDIIKSPRLYFMRNCTEAIRTIPALIHSKLNPEDVDTDGEDHSYDSIRYLVRALFDTPEKPKRTRFVIDVRGNILTVAA